MIVEILILAAGASSRMRGRDKLLEPIGTTPLIAHVASQALATGCPVSVTYDPARPARLQALTGLALRLIPVTDPQAGMTASMQAGLIVLPPASPVMVLLGDMPDLITQDLNLLLTRQAAQPSAILRGCTDDGTPGHPVLFPGWLRPALAALQGDPGPREVLRQYREHIALIPLPAQHALTDLDTPEDWDAWRMRHDQARNKTADS